MKDGKSQNIIIILLLVIIGILGVSCALFATGTVKFNSVDRDQTNQNIVGDNGNEEENSLGNITEEKLQEVISNQLFILFKDSVTKLEDIDNKSKLLLALSILEDEYVTSSSDINTTIVNVSKTKLEEAFNSSVISNLGIKHENFDIYELTGGSTYNRNNNLLMYSKASYYYTFSHAEKVKSYIKDGDQYIISMNYLFPDDTVGYQYYYGSVTDIKNGTNAIVKAYDDNGNYLNAQEYLDNNYDSIKDKLATYTYVFEVKNNKLVLTNYSIN